ncbi:MAG: hypothetical protein JOZ78_23100 [Chroococcidiopsidaceae cyanobacterium CP_BM_ER_R8_30]|nr:hypothetical protein [Chroococcidiopsidaceae cyanobacterium CP_BM_ER_R8_30]
MSEIALVQEVFPEAQIRDFLNRGLERATKTLSTVMARFRGRTYLEWYTYFEERNFQPILREAPILARLELALYEGMVLQAEEAAQNWTNLLPEEREQYRQMALILSEREPTNYTLLDRVGLTYDSVMVAYNFFWQSARRDQLLDKFAHIIFEAIARNSDVEAEQLSTGTWQLVLGTQPLEQILEKSKQQIHRLDQLEPLTEEEKQEQSETFEYLKQEFGWK